VVVGTGGPLVVPRKAVAGGWVRAEPLLRGMGEVPSRGGG
jgi:hypothetical protein